MRRARVEILRSTTSAFLLLVLGSSVVAAAAAAGDEPAASEVMLSVFGNRLRDGGFWRQDNDAFKEGSDVPQYWMQVWRQGPAGEVVIVDAYEVKADACSALMHIVYTYDRKSHRIESHAFGANGVSGHGVVEYKGTTTSSEATIIRPDGREVRMRDRQDHGAAEAVVVQAESWNGSGWAPSKPATWRRSMSGLPCKVPGAGSEPQR